MEHPRLFVVAVVAASVAVGCAGDGGAGLGDNTDRPSDNGGSEPFRAEAAWPSDVNGILVAALDDRLPDQIRMPPEQAVAPFFRPFRAGSTYAAVR